MGESYIEILGWVGSLLLAFCGLPQAVESWRRGSSEGVAWGLLIMWGLGEIFALIYVFEKFDLPLVFNYMANIVFILVIIRYKLWPRDA